MFKIEIKYVDNRDERVGWSYVYRDYDYPVSNEKVANACLNQFKRINPNWTPLKLIVRRYE